MGKEEVETGQEAIDNERVEAEVLLEFWWSGCPSTCVCRRGALVRCSLV